MESTNYGKKIRAYRKLKGYTQQEFAKQVGMSVSVLGDIERGNRQPNDTMLEQMAKVLNISKFQLL
ncbi:MULTISPECIES: helix-turn-helix domain-containing protein [Halalkalibacter]|jgi:transcriptional regulator with XRE-family HTH domain|uniref:Helix-turn-helix domain-containing protein n=1 Tax=Halalkalibacter alkaliphilus TaxID=2917993 RepID=A0A9X2I6K0_9BACI|nr:helix-turn-helix transcriptional regulator [Halalkalibacter alkaliphilus]MCL7749241.1 helix-turn-helix domain-containing protein [Halalkalibacter alkaliphilus]